MSAPASTHAADVVLLDAAIPRAGCPRTGVDALAHGLDLRAESVEALAAKTGVDAHDEE